MPLAGRGGAVKFSSSTSGGGTPALVGDCREWTLNVEAENFEVSTFGSSGWREFQPNLNGGSGTISGYWNVEGSTTMKAIQTHILQQTTKPAELNLLVSNSSGWGYNGDAWITSISPGASVDNIVQFNANFTFNGAVSFSTDL